METKKEESPLDLWFDETEVEEQEIKYEEVIDDVPNEEEEDEQDAQEVNPEEIEDDYESPLPKDKKEVKKDEDSPINESHARIRAKEEGRKRKELEATLTEKQVEFDRLVAEKEALASRLEELENTQLKPDEHPDFIEKRDELLNSTKKRLRRIKAPNSKILFTELEANIKLFKKIDPDDDEKVLEFKTALTEKLFGKDYSSYDDLERQDQIAVDEAFDLIEDNTEKYDELYETLDTLKKRAKAGTLSVGVRDYERTISEYKPLLDAVGDLPEDAIEANPHSLPAFVATLAKTEEGKKRLLASKRDALEIVFGPRPYTQEELTKLEANGTDLKTHFAEREKLVSKKRQKLLPLITQTLMVAGNLPEIFKELAELKGNKEAEESEEEAMRKIRKKKAVPVKEEKKEKDPLDIWFEG